MSKRGDKKRKKQARARRRIEQRRGGRTAAPDPRSITVEVEAIGGVPVSEETILVLAEVARLDSGDVLNFRAPNIVPFYLLKAKALRDVAEPKRKKVVEGAWRGKEGDLRPHDPAAAFDALEDLALAVILSAAAIEAYANNAIRRLPDDALIEVPTRVAGETIPVMRDKAAMEWLALRDKVSRVVPLLTGRPSIKGTQAWQDFRRIIRVRNDLVHVKAEAQNDPDKPSAFGRLMRGEGSGAPEAAVGVIEALEPGSIYEQRVREALGLPAQPAS